MTLQAEDLFEAMQSGEEDDVVGWTAPPAALGPSTLPLHELGDRRFERLAHWWAEVVDGSSAARMHGPSGKRDYGIDVLARRPNGRYWAYQCKCVKEFKTGRLTAAAAEFFAHNVADIERFVIFVACEGDDTGLEPELRRLRADHPNTEIEILYLGNLSNGLQRYPSKVAAMFGPDWARAFCGTGLDVEISGGLHLGDCLPRETKHFIGRQAHLGRALASLAGHDADGTPGLVVVTGSPGVGKTALALRIARRAASEFPNGQLFVADNGGDDLPETLFSIVSGGTRGYQDTHAFKLTRLRMLLSGSRVVIVVDDIQDEETVRELANLVGTTVALVVTSRKKLSGLADLDPVFVDLEVLSQKESTELVTIACGSDRLTVDQSRQLAAACGGLPLAIRIAAARIARRPRLDVDGYLAQLGNPEQGVAALTVGDRSVAAIIDNSYHSMTSGQQEVFHALGSLPQTVIATQAVCAAIAQRPEKFTEALIEEVSAWLDDLFEANLVEEIAPQRFRLHEVLYRYSRAQATESHGLEWRSNAIGNVCRIYEVIARQQVQRIGFVDADATEPAPSNAEAIGILDADVPTIRAIADTARELGLWAPIVTLSQTYSAFLHHRGHFTDFIHIQNLVLQAGQHEGNDEWAAAASVNLAQAARAMGDNETAVTMLRQAQDLAKRSGDVVTFHMAGAAYGNMLAEWAEHDEAIRVLKKTLPIWRVTENPAVLAQTLGNIGAAHVAAGRWRLAEEYLRNARRIDSAGPQIRQMINDSLALLFRRSGRSRVASAESHEELLRSRSVGDREGEAYALLRVAGTHSGSGDFDAAAGTASQALKLFEELGDVKGQITALMDQGTIAAAQGRTDDSLQAFERCTRLAVDVGHVLSGARAASALAGVLWEIGSPQDATQWHETAIGLAQSTGNPIAVASIVASHGLALLAQGLAARATEVLSQAINLLAPLGDSDLLTKTHVATADAMVRAGRAHEALPHLNEILQRDPEATGPQLRSYALRVLAGLFLRRHLFAEASEQCDSALMYAQRSGDASALMECHVIRGHVHMSSGEFREAIADYDKAIELSRTLRRVNAIISIRGNRAQCLAALGEDVEAIEEVRMLIDYCRKLRNSGTEVSMLTVLGTLLARQGDDDAALSTLRMAQSRALANGDEALAAKGAMALAELHHGRGEHEHAADSARLARKVFIKQADWRSAADAARIEVVNVYRTGPNGYFDDFYRNFAEQLPASVRLVLERQLEMPALPDPTKLRENSARRTITIAEDVRAALIGIEISALTEHLGNSRQRCYLCRLPVAETGAANLILLRSLQRRDGDPFWVRLVHPLCGPSAILTTVEKQPQARYDIEIECLIPAPDVAAITVDCIGTIMANRSSGPQSDILLSILRQEGFQDVHPELERPQQIELTHSTKVHAALNLNLLTITVNGLPVIDKAPLNFLPDWYASARKGVIIAIFGRNLQGFSWDDPRAMRRAAANSQVVAAAIPLTVTPPSRNASCVCQMGAGQRFKRCCGVGAQTSQ